MNTNFDVNPNEFDYLKEVRHKIHSRPCLSGNEKETADIIAEELEKCSPDKINRSPLIHGYSLCLCTYCRSGNFSAWILADIRADGLDRDL